jgi:hypothetical protein
VLFQLEKQSSFQYLILNVSLQNFLNSKHSRNWGFVPRHLQDQVTQLHASIDGEDIPKSELEKYRIQSPPFYFALPENNILDLSANTTTQAVSVFVKPLSLGKHEISFGGDVTGADDNAASSAESSGWNYNTTYELMIH